MGKLYYQPTERIHNQDKSYQQNPDGKWSEAVPLPFYGIKKVCQCGKRFWKEANYMKHYIKVHTDGKKYKRIGRGFKVTDA